MSTIYKLFKEKAPDDMGDKKRLMRDTLCEFLMTTVFVNFGTLSAVSTGSVSPDGAMVVARVLPIAFSFGVSIMALAYAFGHITGGHMNPGVSLLMFFRREISLVKMVLYWLAQFTGGLLGAAITWGCTSGLKDVELGKPPFDLGSTTLSDSLTTGNGFLLEFMGSFFFYLVIAQTALDKRGVASTPFPAIPIGFILIVVHICLIPFTGCGVNPARTFGPSMVTCMESSDRCDVVADDWYWIYYIGPFLASFCVAEITQLLACDEVDGDSQTTTDEGGETNVVKDDRSSHA